MMTDTTKKTSLDAESTKIEKGFGEPTCRLVWRDGVLMQLFECTDRHMHYFNGHYGDSTYHRREEWRPIPKESN